MTDDATPTKPDAIAIREATLDDAESLIGFNAALARESEDLELDRERLSRGVRRALSDESGAHYWVAEVAHPNGEREPIGCTMVTTELSDWRDGELWWIQSVYVAQAWRKQGIFTRLFRHIEARAQGAPSVVGLRLYVERENHRARAIYEHLGLHQTSYLLLERDFVLDREPDDAA